MSGSVAQVDHGKLSLDNLTSALILLGTRVKKTILILFLGKGIISTTS